MTSFGAVEVSREQALAFRLQSHNLARRLPQGSLLLAAGACGVQNSPPGSAALALHARVERLTPEDVDRALTVDRTLLQAWSLRASPHLFPTEDAAVFSRGLLPEDEASLRFLIQGVQPSVDRLGMSATEALELTADALKAELNGKAMTKRNLAPILADRLATRLTPEQLALWKAPSPYIQGVSWGEAVVRFALYVCGLRGEVCFGKRSGNEAFLVRPEQWLGTPLQVAKAEDARAELIRRYLHCYGPSVPGDLAGWAGISPDQAAGAWKLAERELAEVRFAGRQAWALRQDMPAIMAPQPAAKGVRFLPPHEPLLQLRDRETLIPDPALRREIWKTLHNPGVVLLDDRPAGEWQAKKSGRRLDLKVRLFEALPEDSRADIEAEAATLAPFKGCTSAPVKFTGPDGP